MPQASVIKNQFEEIEMDQSALINEFSEIHNNS